MSLFAPTELDQIRTLQEWGHSLREIAALTHISASVIDQALWIAIDHSQANEARACRMLATATRYEARA